MKYEHVVFSALGLMCLCVAACKSPPRSLPTPPPASDAPRAITPSISSSEPGSHDDAEDVDAGYAAAVAECAASDACRLWGVCGVTTEREILGDACAPDELDELDPSSDDEEPYDSYESETPGYMDCSDEYVCEITQGGCERSVACEREGRCSVQHDPNSPEVYCGPDSEGDCLGSVGCREEGNCRFIEGVDGDGIHECASHGCDETTACAADGACGYVVHEDYWECAPTHQDHCAGSEGCAADGSCGLVETEESSNVCEPTSAEHCARSTGCQAEGRCTFDADARVCW